MPHHTCSILHITRTTGYQPCSFIQVTEIRQAFGLAVRIFRERRGWNQAQLANASDIDRGYISRIETGLVDPGLQVQRRLAEALGVSLTELVAQAEEELERRRKRSSPDDDRASWP
jgi:transcriptional regulator with XRE-family HTH domain